MENKTVLITGSAKRIGRAIALSMAESGWNVAVHYNVSQNEAEDLQKHIKSLGVKSCIVHADLRNEAQLRDIFPQVNHKLGVVDCLINNASVFKNDNIDSFTATSWHENMAVNLYAPTILMQEFTKQLPKEIGGNIVNMLDYAVLRFPERFMSYTASKSALWTLTQSLALALAKRRVRVNGVGPGRILHNPYDNQASFLEAVQAAPLGEDSTPEEICRAISFILSATSMTGQMIALDGGKHLIGPEVY